MKSLLAAGAILTAALSFKVGMSMTAPASHAAIVSVPAPRVLAASESSVVAHPAPHTGRVHARRAGEVPLTPATIDALNDVLDVYCFDCHSNDMQLGNLSLEGFDIGRADTARAKAEKVVRKLRAEMMPLAGRPRPPSDTLQMIASAIERVIDRASPPNAGSRTFQRLNRAEYENAVQRSARRATSTRANICRSTRRARTSTTSPTCRCCRRRCSTRT